ncbi:DNA-processing protein DprA [Namhaeicola litoreus]|uniref:DNA-processing protein DprA n=1 Tax=Namhaeicola litoreus TaxID=1052145 RepID=A0ABW3Y1A9_9FLAO
MDNSEKIYLLALHKAFGIGDITAKKLFQACGSAEAIFKEKREKLQKIYGIGKATIDGLMKSSLLQNAEKELIFCDKNNIEVHGFLDQTYPEKLKHCSDGPLLIFTKGNVYFEKQRSVSIIGTRMMTNYGKSFLEEFMAEIKIHNPIIISGLAYGVDIYAHKLALEHNLQTIAVLAHGLDVIYPKIHQKYADQMQEYGGIISDFWSKTNPDRENFIKRNRIVAGISEATIVIESAKKGGSLITADIANSYHRDVFAVPGRVTDTYSQGCNELIKQNKAALLSSVSDLVYFLNWDIQDNKPKTIQKQLFLELSDIEQTIYQFLLENGKQTLDHISLHCEIPIFKTAPILLDLELKGALRPHPGKIFEAI